MSTTLLFTLVVCLAGGATIASALHLSAGDAAHIIKKSSESGIQTTTTSALIHNNLPRRDVNGNILHVADGSLVEHEGMFYLYGVVYQPCPVSEQPKCYADCGYYNNTFAVYVSKNLTSWELGSDSVLPLVHSDGPLNSNATVYFSPFVIFNKKTSKFVMWMQYKFSQKAVATSDHPLGPFVMKHFPNATGIPMDLMKGSSVYVWKERTMKQLTGGGGDDTEENENQDRDHLAGKEEKAYMVFNIILKQNETSSAMFVSELSDDYTTVLSPTPVHWNCEPTAHSDPIGRNSRCFQEGGGIFQHYDHSINKTLWIVMAGNGCCFCALGGDTKVWISQNGPLGPYNHTGYLNPPLPNPPNATYTPYTIPAQQFGVHPVSVKNPRTGKRMIQPMYIGMRWGSALNGLKNDDFQYWAPIEVQGGTVKELAWQDNFTLELWN